MHIIHTILQAKFSWYRRWHYHPLHPHAHWSMLGAVVLGVALSFWSLGWMGFSDVLPSAVAQTGISLQGYPDTSGDVPFQFADLDGDGTFEFLVKRNKFQYRYPVLDPEKLFAYDRQGRLLWTFTYNLGVFPGLYGSSPVAAIDADGDGKDEVYTAEAGNNGSCCTESIKKLDPTTGTVLASASMPGPLDYLDYTNNGYSHSGDDYNYHRAYLTSAYLDGYDNLPSIVLVRGWFGSISVWAYDHHLNIRWKFEERGLGAGGSSPYAGTGSATSPVAADLDGDGREDIFIGSAAVDSFGGPMWILGGFAHASDGSTLGEFNPDNPGLEVYTGANGDDSRELALGMGTSKGDWFGNWPKNHELEHTGLIADLDLSKPGFEVYGRRYGLPANDPNSWFLYDAHGNSIPNNYSIPTWTQIPLAAWWDGTAKMDILGVGAPDKNGFTQVGDIQGDWREEVITGQDGLITIHSPDGIPQLDIPTLRGDKFYYKALTTTNGYYTRPTILTRIEELASSPAGRVPKIDNSGGSQCVSAGQWQNDGCGRGNCSANLMHQTRTVDPLGCASTARCIAGPQCGNSGTTSADLNADGIINVSDLGILFSAWGSAAKPAADLNQDNRVDIIDLGICLSNWTGL